MQRCGLGIALWVVVALGGCGDDAVWPSGKSAPPLNAGPGVNSLFTPPDNAKSPVGSSSVIGDWFRCRGEGSDPCTTLENPGVGFRADGTVVGLLGGLGKTMERGTPYCEIKLGKRWTMKDGELTVEGEKGARFEVNGDRATVTDNDRTITYLRQSLSIGVCSVSPDPG